MEIEGKRAKVYVTEDQQSIAIGRQGQNVRLASKLTGYELDIELAKAPEKKKRKNAEDSLLNALSAASDEGSAEASVEGANEASSDVAEKVPATVEKADEVADEKSAAKEALDKVVEIDGEEKTSTAEE